MCASVGGRVGGRVWWLCGCICQEINHAARIGVAHGTSRPDEMCRSNETQERTAEQPPCQFKSGEIGIGDGGIGDGVWDGGALGSSR